MARKRNRCVSNLCVLVDYGLVTKGHDDESKARFYDHQGGEALPRSLQLDAKCIDTFCASIDSLKSAVFFNAELDDSQIISRRNPVFW